MTTATVRFVNGLSSVEPGASILRTDWNTIGNGPYTCKIKRYDLESPTIEVKNISPGTVHPERWEHCVMIRDTVYPYNSSKGLLVYVIKAMRQGPVGTVLVASTGTPVTNDNGTMEFDLELDCLATYHANNRGQSTPSDWQLKARWSRYPVPGGPLEQFQIRPAQMMRTLNRTKLPKISSTIVTSTDALEIVFVKVSAVINGELTHLSAFAALSNSDGRYVSNYLAIGSGTNMQYPSLRGIMNYLPTILGISASNIIDVSVSEACPLKFVYNAGAGTGGRDQICMQDTLTIEYFNFTISGNTYHCAFERLEGMLLDFKPTTVKIQLTDKERFLGQVALVGSDNSIVTTIDTRYADYNSVSQKWEISMSYYCKVELGSMYSELVLKDSSIIRFPEGHLPFVGDSWTEYVNTQRSYDREMAVIEKEKAQVDMVTGLGASLANGAFAAAFSGGAAVGTAAFGIVGNVANWYEGERARENQLQAKDMLMHAAPDTVYSPEYGVGYLNSMLKSDPMRIFIVLMPDGVSDGDLTNYTLRHGYPVTDWENTLAYSSMPSEGFMQGELIDPNGSNTLVRLGEYKRIFARQLRQGIHFKMIT